MNPQDLFDPDREKRTHVVNVRSDGKRWLIVLSDNSEVEWDVWCSMSQAERRSQ